MTSLGKRAVTKPGQQRLFAYGSLLDRRTMFDRAPAALPVSRGFSRIGDLHSAGVSPTSPSARSAGSRGPLVR